jgi:hypothetical protein
MFRAARTGVGDSGSTDRNLLSSNSLVHVTVGRGCRRLVDIIVNGKVIETVVCRWGRGGIEWSGGTACRVTR